MILFGQKLALLIFVKPRDGLDVNIKLCEGRTDVFTQNLFDPGYSEK
jgi:hypothetical protein